MRRLNCLRRISKADGLRRHRLKPGPVGTEPISMGSELISEVMDGVGLGIKVRVYGSARRESLQVIGEAWANAARGRSDRIWVWLYTPDMDIEGPAMSVTYLEGEGCPRSDFVDPATILLYYLGDPFARMGHRHVA